jgi:hypothetical protein
MHVVTRHRSQLIARAFAPSYPFAPGPDIARPRLFRSALRYIPASPITSLIAALPASFYFIARHPYRGSSPPSPSSWATLGYRT